MKKKYIIGSRGSKLALWQAHWVRDRLAEFFPAAEFAVEVIKTEGDRRHDLSPEAFGREGIFTAELDRALLSRRIDFAAHSLKDLPTGLAAGLTLAAVTERAPVSDLFILRGDLAAKHGLSEQSSLADFLSRLEKPLVIATSSLRRQAQLKHRFPSLKFVPLRGNLDTRLKKLASGEMDAIIVAEAGLFRLGLSLGGHLGLRIPTELCLPAAGQGALALETRADDPAAAIADRLNHPATRSAVTAERTAMAALGAGCRVPAGFLGQVSGDTLHLAGVAAHPEGQPLLRAKVSGRREDAEQLGRELAAKLLAQGADQVVKLMRQPSSGRVALVGAGPGDPGLLTLRALELIERAEVILFDQLVDERIREMFPAAAEQIFVGKEGGTHYVTQDETMRVLVEKAREGKRVLRLKGGDPFVFGRGGEEAEACADAGVPFEVVPGITAGIAAAAYAGIPVTHRDHSASLALITGHRRGDREDLDIPAPEAETLVYYMGIKNLPRVVSSLLAAGWAAETPIALIHRGTTPFQRVVTGTISDISLRAKEDGLKPPAVIVVGEVVRYRERLRWFETRPLFGLTVLITRPRDQAPELRKKLADQGAAVISMPAIEIQDLSDYAELDQALAVLSSYHYLVFTSVNGVKAFFERLAAGGRDARALAGLATACIGPRTAEALKERGVKCDLLPEKFVAESLLEVFPADLAGKKVLLPRALQAREILPEQLRERGAQVDVVSAYETVAAPDAAPVPDHVDLAVFTSSSTAEHFLARGKLPAGCKVACIGPITAATLRERGVQVDIEAKEHTMDGVVAAIEEYYSTHAHERR